MTDPKIRSRIKESAGAMKTQAEVEEESTKVREMLKKEVVDWDEEVKVNARFKALSGQRCDWEPLYLFWRELIIKVARYLRVFVISPSQVKNIWFSLGGLSPLCMDRVLLEMYTAGELLEKGANGEPTTGRLSWILQGLAHLVGLSRFSTLEKLPEDYYILPTLLEEKANEVVRRISENHWTSSCVITLKNFQEVCGGSLEASMVLGHLSGRGKAKYIVMNKKDMIEGVKISLSARAVSSTKSLDYDVLHLIWTVERLEQQIDMIDKQYEKSKESALASLRSGNRTVARRHARQLKLTSITRDKCSLLLEKVEEVLRIIADAESANQVSEAIQIGARAIKESRITIEEVELCLDEFNESIDSHNKVIDVLGSFPDHSGLDDEDVEEDMNALEIIVGTVPIQRIDGQILEPTAENQEVADILVSSVSKLNLGDGAPEQMAHHCLE